MNSQDIGPSVKKDMALVRVLVLALALALALPARACRPHLLTAFARSLRRVRVARIAVAGVAGGLVHERIQHCLLCFTKLGLDDLGIAALGNLGCSPARPLVPATVSA